MGKKELKTELKAFIDEEFLDEEDAYKGEAYQFGEQYFHEADFLRDAYRTNNDVLIEACEQVILKRLHDPLFRILIIP